MDQKLSVKMFLRLIPLLANHNLRIHLILMNEVDPFALAQAIIEKLQWIDTLANRLWSPQPAPRGSVTFLTTRQLDPGFHP